MSQAPTGVVVNFSLGKTDYIQELEKIKETTATTLSSGGGVIVPIKFGITDAIRDLDAALQSLQQRYASTGLNIPVNLVMPNGAGGYNAGASSTSPSFNQTGPAPTVSVGNVPPPPPSFGGVIPQLAVAEADQYGPNYMAAVRTEAQYAFLDGGPAARKGVYENRARQSMHADEPGDMYSLSTSAGREEARIRGMDSSHAASAGSAYNRLEVAEAKFAGGQSAVVSVRENQAAEAAKTQSDAELLKAQASLTDAIRIETAQKADLIDQQRMFEAKSQGLVETAETAGAMAGEYEAAGNLPKARRFRGIQQAAELRMINQAKRANPEAGGEPEEEPEKPSVWNAKMPFGKLFMVHTALQTFSTAIEAQRQYNLQTATAGSETDYLRASLTKRDTLANTLYGLPGIMDDLIHGDLTGERRAEIEHTLYSTQLNEQHAQTNAQFQEARKQFAAESSTHLAQGDYSKTITSAHEAQQAIERDRNTKILELSKDQKYLDAQARAEEANKALQDEEDNPTGDPADRGTALKLLREDAATAAASFQEQKDIVKRKAEALKGEITKSKAEEAHDTLLANVSLQQDRIQTAAAEQQAKYAGTGQSGTAKIAADRANFMAALELVIKQPNSDEAWNALNRAGAQGAGDIAGMQYEANLAGQQAKLSSGYFAEIQRTGRPLEAELSMRAGQQQIEMTEWRKKLGLEDSSHDNDTAVLAKQKANEDELTQARIKGLADRELAHTESGLRVIRTKQSVNEAVLQAGGETAIAQITQTQQRGEEQIKSLEAQEDAARKTFNFDQADNLKAQREALEKAQPGIIAAMEAQHEREMAQTTRGLVASAAASPLRGAGAAYAASLVEYDAQQENVRISMQAKLDVAKTAQGNTNPLDPDVVARAAKEVSELTDQIDKLGKASVAGREAIIQAHGIQQADTQARIDETNLQSTWHPRAAQMRAIEQQRTDSIRMAAGNQKDIDLANQTAASQIGALIHSTLAPPAILHSASDIHERMQQGILEHPLNDTTIGQMRSKMKHLLGTDTTEQDARASRLGLHHRLFHDYSGHKVDSDGNPIGGDSRGLHHREGYDQSGHKIGGPVHPREPWYAGTGWKKKYDDEYMAELTRKHNHTTKGENPTHKYYTGDPLDPWTSNPEYKHGHMDIGRLFNGQYKDSSGHINVFGNKDTKMMHDAAVNYGQKLIDTLSKLPHLAVIPDAG